MLPGRQQPPVRTRSSSCGHDWTANPSRTALQSQTGACPDASRRFTICTTSSPLTEVCSSTSKCRGGSAGSARSAPSVPCSGCAVSAEHGHQLDLSTTSCDLLQAGSKISSRSRDSSQLKLQNSLSSSSRRHSDPHLVVTSFLLPEVSSSSTLSVCHCHGYLGPVDGGTLSSPQADAVMRLDPQQEQATSKVSPRVNAPVTAESQPRVKEIESLSGGPHHLNKPVYQHAPEAWRSSTPDLRTDHSHVAGGHRYHQVTCSSGQDDTSDDDQREQDRHNHRLSKISQIFSKLLPDRGGAHRPACPCDSLARRRSMDSQMLYRTRSQAWRPVSRRTIKISSPGHTRAMLISGGDTLGGLPDSDDNSKRRSSDARFPASGMSGSPELSLYSHHRRRSSCPVIFENEESHEGSSPKKLGSQELEADIRSSASSLSSSEDPRPSQSSPKLSVEKSGQFYLGSSLLKAPGSMKKKATSRQLLAGVTFIVDKQSTAGGRLGASSGSSSDELSTTYRQTGSGKQGQRDRQEKGGTGEDNQVTKTDSRIRAAGSRRVSRSRPNSGSRSRPTSGRSSPASRPMSRSRPTSGRSSPASRPMSRSRPTSGRSSPASRPMSRACTNSSSSSLTADENILGHASSQSSDTSSADDIS